MKPPARGGDGSRSAHRPSEKPDQGSGGPTTRLTNEGYRRLVAANVVGLVVADASGAVIEANDYYLQLIGYTREEFTRGGINWRALTPPEWLPADERAIAELREHGTCAPYEKEYQRRDQTRVPVLLVDATMSGSQEQIAAFVLDLTVRKQAEALARKSEERYRSLFENMLNGFAYCRMEFTEGKPSDFVYLDVNRAFETLTGLKNVVGRRASEVIPGIREDDPNLMETYGRVARTGRPEVFETFVASLGMWFSISVYSPARDHFVAVFDVITQRKQAEEKLRLFRELIERSSDAIEVVDPTDGRLLDVNETACRMLGYTRDELLTLTIFDINRDLDRAEFEARGARMYQGERLTIATRHWRKDGTSFPVEASVSPVTLDRAYRLSIVRDISGRKKVDDELRLQVAALNAAANAIVITNPEGKIQWANAAFAAISGYSADESIGRNLRELVRSGRQDRRFYEQMWDTILTGRVWHGEIVNRRKDGTLYTEEMTITPVRGERDAITHFIAIKQDITARKLAEARLAEQAALLDRASDAIYVTAMDCTILYWNPAAERIYGWPAAEAVGRKTSELNSVDEHLVAAAVAQTLEKGEWTGERRQSTKAGRTVEVLSRLTLLRDDQGQPQSILVINTDITEKKELEARFLRAQRLESLGALASGIAHDLNNVLAPIMMSTPLLRESVRDETARGLVGMVETSAQRGAEIVRQVLTFARGSVGERIVLQPKHLVRDMLKMAAETFPKNLQVEDRSGKDVWTVEGDATQLHQALMNLCVNARDSMPEGGRLGLGVENVTLDEATAAQTPGAAAGRYVRFRVTDTGHGIPPEVQQRIFEPFFTTKGVGKGTGLGLSTVLGIVKGHGGFVRVDSQVGRGTTFDLYFPASAGMAVRISSPPSTVPPWPRADGELVLLVDDEAAIRAVVRQALEEFGYRVLLCEAGAEAVRVFKASRAEIRLVVTDMMMPEMDGPTLVQALRAVDPAVRIVGITGVADDATMKQVQGLHLAAMLAKPFTIGQLLATVREAMAPAAKTEPS